MINRVLQSDGAAGGHANSHWATRRVEQQGTNTVFDVAQQLHIVGCAI